MTAATAACILWTVVIGTILAVGALATVLAWAAKGKQMQERDQ